MLNSSNVDANFFEIILRKISEYIGNLCMNKMLLPILLCILFSTISIALFFRKNKFHKGQTLCKVIFKYVSLSLAVFFALYIVERAFANYIAIKEPINSDTPLIDLILGTISTITAIAAISISRSQAEKEEFEFCENLGFQDLDSDFKAECIFSPFDEKNKTAVKMDLFEYNASFNIINYSKALNKSQLFNIFKLTFHMTSILNPQIIYKIEEVEISREGYLYSERKKTHNKTNLLQKIKKHFSDENVHLNNKNDEQIVYDKVGMSICNETAVQSKDCRTVISIYILEDKADNADKLKHLCEPGLFLTKNEDEYRLKLRLAIISPKHMLSKGDSFTVQIHLKKDSAKKRF